MGRLLLVSGWRYVHYSAEHILSRHLLSFRVGSMTLRETTSFGEFMTLFDGSKQRQIRDAVKQIRGQCGSHCWLRVGKHIFVLKRGFYHDYGKRESVS